MLPSRGCFSSGELSRAEAVIGELGRVAEDAGDAQNKVFSKTLYALANTYQGRLTESAALLDASIEDAKAIPDYQSLCQSYGNRAFCALCMGDFERAALLVDGGLVLLRKTRVAPHNTDSLRYAQAWLALTLLEHTTDSDKAATQGKMDIAIKELHHLSRVYRGAIPIALC